MTVGIKRYLYWFSVLGSGHLGLIGDTIPTLGHGR